MSSDYEYSDEDAEYYDDDEEMMDTQEDGQRAVRILLTLTDLSCKLGSAPSDDDVDMDGFNDDFKVTSSKGKRKSYEIDYESLSQTDVEKLMSQDIDHISGIFGVDVSVMAFMSSTQYLR
jgi:ariadne-1